MKASFLAALLSTASVAAHDWQHTWSPRVSQEQHEHNIGKFANVVGTVLDLWNSNVPESRPVSFENASIATCAACEGGVKLAQSLVESSFLLTIGMRIANDVCYLGKAYINHSTCYDYANEAMGPILYNLANSQLSPSFACEVKFGYCNRHNYTLMPVQDYIDRVLATKPAYLDSDNFIDFKYAEIARDQGDRKEISLVQFSDFHVDLDYAVGAAIDCGDILCCRAEFGFPTDPSNAAGEFGELVWCDIPKSVIGKMTEKVNELAPDAYMWTGDGPPHDQWAYSLQSEKRYQDYLFEVMSEDLGSLNAYPSLGNHDFGLVMNSENFNSGVPDPDVAYVADQWSRWLSDEAIAEFLKNGCYSETFKATDGTVYPNVKVIGINSEASYNSNWYLMSQRDDAGGILAWLEETLLEMEANG